MAQSEAQKRRNAAGNVRIESEPSPLDAADLLSALDAAGDWGIPPAASGGAGKGSRSSLPPIAWPDDLAALAESLGVALPPSPPRERPAGAPDRWMIVAAPADLTALNAPIPEAPERAKGAAPLLYGVMHGRFTTATGHVVSLPSMANGQPLPLIVLLKVLSKAPNLVGKVKYVRSLCGGRQTIMGNLADKSGRYCFLDADFNLWLTDTLIG